MALNHNQVGEAWWIDVALEQPQHNDNDDDVAASFLFVSVWASDVTTKYIYVHMLARLYMVYGTAKPR